MSGSIHRKNHKSNIGYLNVNFIATWVICYVVLFLWYDHDFLSFVIVLNKLNKSKSLMKISLVVFIYMMFEKMQQKNMQQRHV